MSVRLSQFSNEDSPIEISPGSEWEEEDAPLTWSREIWRQLTEASPLLCTNLSINLLSTVSLAFVGQLGLDQLAAVCLATCLMTGTLVLILGHTNALSNFCQDAYENAIEANEEGEDDLADQEFRKVGLWLQLGSLLPLMLFMPLVVAVWGHSGQLLSYLGACEAEVCEMTTLFSTVSILWVIPFSLYQCVSVYLETIRIVWPQAAIQLAFCPVGIAVNYVLVFGLEWASIPFTGFGLLGSALATSVVQWVQLLALIFFVWGGATYQPAVQVTWKGWSWEAFSWDRSKKFIALGLPMSIWDLLESWVPGILVCVAGTIGAEQVAASGIVLSAVVLCQPLVLSFKYTMFARIDYHFEEGNPSLARDTYFAGLTGSILMSVLVGLCMWHLFAQGANYFTDSQPVAQLSQQMMPAAVAYFVLFCVNSYNFELQNAKEEQMRANLCSLLGRWCVGIGAMSVAVFHANWGDKALWPCLFLGEFCHAIFLMVFACQTDWEAQSIFIWESPSPENIHQSISASGGKPNYGATSQN